MDVAIALVEPQYHINVGHVSRLMKNFGLHRLYLVNPHYKRKEAVKYSTHGKDVLAAGLCLTRETHEVETALVPFPLRRFRTAHPAFR